MTFGASQGFHDVGLGPVGSVFGSRNDLLTHESQLCTSSLWFALSRFKVFLQNSSFRRHTIQWVVRGGLGVEKQALGAVAGDCAGGLLALSSAGKGGGGTSMTPCHLPRPEPRWAARLGEVRPGQVS